MYVAAPVTGVKDRNSKVFESARERLEKVGAVPVIPLDYVSEDASHDDAMEICRRLLGVCTVLMLTGNWAFSEGAREERGIALKVGIPIFYDTTGLGFHGRFSGD